ncbi:MAG: hypothetical protein ACK5MZ_03445 [Aestuariibaculum sp.]
MDFTFIFSAFIVLGQWFYSVFNICVVLFLFSIVLIVILLVLFWKIYLKSKKLEYTLLNKVSFMEKTNKIQNAISNEMLDFYGNKLAAMENTFEIIKDVNEKKSKNIKDIEIFCEHFESNLSLIKDGFEELIWANKTENNTLGSTTDKILAFVREKSKQKDINISIETSLTTNYKTPRYWNRQFYLIIKEAICCLLESTHVIEIKVLGLNHGIVQVILKGYKCNKLNLKSIKQRSNSIDTILKYNESQESCTIDISAEIPLLKP